MWPPARIATSALSVAAIAAIVVLLALGGGANAPALTGGGAAVGAGGAPPARDAPCGSDTDRVYLATAHTVARRIADEERAGTTVLRALDTISSDAVLARAVARGDRRAVRREMLVLLFNHEHIVRLRVLRAGRLLDDVGGPYVLTPVYGSLRHGGRVVGTFSFSVQDDLGYRLLVERLVGAATVMRYEGRTVMESIAAGARPLADGGVAEIGGVAYLVSSIDVGRFPSGSLHIALLVPRPPAALARQSCAQVRADVLGGVARRVYGESLTGPAITSARAGVRHDRTLARALARGDDATARRQVRELFAEVHLVRLQVRAGGRVIADMGTTQPLVAPVTVPIAEGAGGSVGSALMAVQSVNGFVGVSSYLTKGLLLVRAGQRQIAGRVAGPAALPASGPVSYAGRRYAVSSFAGTLFGGDAVRVYTLVRDYG